MNSESIAVRIRRLDGSEVQATLSFARAEPTWLALTTDLAFTVRFEGVDLFACLQDLRRHLRTKSEILLCNGARRDVFPSGMSRQMSGGRIAYKLQMVGRPPGRDDLIDIFGACEPEAVATVDEQREFHEQWASSLRGKK